MSWRHTADMLATEINTVKLRCVFCWILIIRAAAPFSQTKLKIQTWNNQSIADHCFECIVHHNVFNHWFQEGVLLSHDPHWQAGEQQVSNGHRWILNPQPNTLDGAHWHFYSGHSSNPTTVNPGCVVILNMVEHRRGVQSRGRRRMLPGDGVVLYLFSEMIQSYASSISTSSKSRGSCKAAFWQRGTILSADKDCKI